MGVPIGDNKVVITTKPETICFDLPKDVENNLKHEINSIIKYDELLAEYAIKTKLGNYCPQVSMEMKY